MKVLILTLSLLMSAVSIAETVQSLSAQRVIRQEGSWDIVATGRLSNGCLSTPQAMIVPHPTLKNTLELHIVAERTGEMCAQVMGAPYTIKADIRALIRKSEIEIVANQEYLLIAKGSDFSTKFSGNDILAFRPKQSKVEGTLFRTNEGQLALMTDNHRLVLIDDSMFSAHQYVQQRVEVTGYVLQGLRQSGQMTPMVAFQPSPPLYRMIVASIALLE